MDDSRNVPAASGAEPETFRTEASPVPSTETSDNPEAAAGAPIDVPGVGLCDALGAPFTQKPARPYAAGEVPPMLHAHLREYILAQLLFAARNLALESIASSWDNGQMYSGCLRCGVGWLTGQGNGNHATRCWTGRVLHLIDELYAVTPQPQLKEAVQAQQERLGADDGTRSRGVSLADAARSLRNAALEEIVQLGTRPTWQCNVCGSSVTGLDKTGSDILHGCDCWVGNALVVTASGGLEGGAR